MNENEKAELGARTFQDFCEQFGQDVYAHVLLEELLEGLINAETLFIFGEQEQTGNQIDHSTPGERDNKFGNHRPVIVQPAPDMAETNRPTYP